MAITDESFNPLDHPYCVKPGTKVDLSKIDPNDKSIFPVKKEESQELLLPLQQEIGDLQELLFAEEKRKLLVVFQAMDTGGKDGTIRKVFQEMDPQGIRVSAFKAPTKKELSYDYLWRIHQEVPEKGMCVIFNRSHYEDIAAVRVRELAPESVWENRYDHIVNFEKMLADEGTTILKFFLHIDLEEQAERLQARLDEPAKHWKFNPADLHDRALFPKYMKVYEDILSRTSTPHAPWFVIPANRKWHRTLAVSQIVIQALRALDMQYPRVEFDPSTVDLG